MAERATDSAVAEIKGFQGDASAVSYATNIREIARVYKWLEGVMAAYTARPDAKPDTINVLGDIRTGLAAALRVLRRNAGLGDRILLIRLADRTGWKSPFDLIALIEEQPGGILQTIRELTGLDSPAIVWILVAGVMTMTAGVVGYMNVKLIQAITARASAAAAKTAAETRRLDAQTLLLLREEGVSEADARDIMARGPYRSELWGTARQFMDLAKIGLYVGGAALVFKYLSPFLKRYIG